MSCLVISPRRLRTRREVAFMWSVHHSSCLVLALRVGVRAITVQTAKSQVALLDRFAVLFIDGSLQYHQSIMSGLGDRVEYSEAVTTPECPGRSRKHRPAESIWPRIVCLSALLARQPILSHTQGVISVTPSLPTLPMSGKKKKKRKRRKGTMAQRLRRSCDDAVLLHCMWRVGYSFLYKSVSFQGSIKCGTE